MRFLATGEADVLWAEPSAFVPRGHRRTGRSQLYLPCVCRDQTDLGTGLLRRAADQRGVGAGLRMKPSSSIWAGDMDTPVML